MSSSRSSAELWYGTKLNDLVALVSIECTGSEAESEGGEELASPPTPRVGLAAVELVIVVVWTWFSIVLESLNFLWNSVMKLEQWALISL